MSAFEFAFSLFALVLGLTLVEVLGGLGRLFRARRRLRIGWLTPMLAVFVMMDLLSFWTTCWVLRDRLPVSYGTLLIGLVIAGGYYLAAMMIVPERLAGEGDGSGVDDGVPDLDRHYLSIRRPVLGTVLVCNVVPMSLAAWEIGHRYSALDWVLIGSYLALLTLCLVGGRRLNRFALAGLILVYLVNAL
jgi:hypothetical protein